MANTGEAVVRYHYDASEPTEISLKVGDIIRILNTNLEKAGWWQGEIHGKIGVFPAGKVELLPRLNRKDSNPCQSIGKTAILKPLPKPRTKLPATAKKDDKSSSDRIQQPGSHRTTYGVKEQCFAEETTIYKEEYCLSPSRHKFVCLFWQQKLDLIAASLSEFRVQICIENDLDNVICATGSEKGLNLLMKELQKLGEQVLCHTITVEDPRIVRFFTKENNCKQLDIFQRCSHCVLGLCKEVNVLQVKRSDRHQNAGEMALIRDMIILKSLQLHDDVALFLLHGDVIHAVVDIIVLEMNKKMASFRDLADKGFVAGDVSVRSPGPGHCFCNFIIDAVSSIYTEDKRRGATCLFHTIVCCLEIADIYSCNSIAIPAFGVHSGYPVAECTRLVVEAVKTYVKTRSHGNIKEIYLCADNSNIFQQFCTSIQKVFPQETSALFFPHCKRKSEQNSFNDIFTTNTSLHKVIKLHVYAEDEENIRKLLDCVTGLTVPIINISGDTEA